MNYGEIVRGEAIKHRRKSIRMKPGFRESENFKIMIGNEVLKYSGLV